MAKFRKPKKKVYIPSREVKIATYKGESPRCGGTNIEKGHQEVFPSTFMKDSRYSLIKALANSKEFEIYACMTCGYSEWYIQEKYLDGKAKISERARVQVL